MRRLQTPLQRLLFVIGIACLLPWVIARVLGEIFRESTVSGYLQKVIEPPLDAWQWLFDSYHHHSEWFDKIMLPGALALFAAFYWPKTGGRLLRWILGRPS